jgi:hypothetical protein
MLGPTKTVEAVVTDLVREPPYTYLELQTKGRPDIVRKVPARFVVVFSYHGLTFTQGYETDKFGGWRKGMTKRATLQEGGLTHQRYLSE